VEEKEKRGKKKNCRRSFSISWMPTHAAPPCRKGRAASDDVPKGYQWPPEGASQKARTLPTCGRMLCTFQLLFLNYRKTRIPLTAHDNCRKTEVKKPKVLLDLRQKKVDPMGYAVSTLYKKYENPRTPLKH